MMIRTAVAGNFFPLHDGHIDHLEKARKLGDYLIAIIGSDDHLRRKGKPILLSLEARIRVLKAIRYVDEVVVAVDKDGTCAKTLEIIRPNIFAKGEDYTKTSMPQNELAICKEISCQIVYGIGKKLNSSTKLVGKVCKAL